MSFSLSNPYLHFTLHPSSSSWSLYPQQSETPSIEGARLNGLFRLDDWKWPHLGGLRRWAWGGNLKNAEFSRRAVESAHGPLDTLVLRAPSGADPVAITVEFALPREKPFLLWRVRVRNSGRRAFRVSRINTLCAGPLYQTGRLRLSAEPRPLTFFSNGWQSWSFAGTLASHQPQPHTALGLLQGPPNYNPSTPVYKSRGRFSGDMFGVLADPAGRGAIVAGFLSQREQFGSIEAATDPASPSLRLRAQGDDVVVPPDGELRTDWSYVQLLAAAGLDPLEEYTLAVARENNARVPSRTPVGWCSWYQYFDRVTEADMRANLEQIADGRDTLPLTLVQLDDGYESNVGDWLEPNAKFPSGLPALAESIRQRGLTPGLWLAPFIVKPDSTLARDHPDWLLRGPLNAPTNAGYVFDAFACGLDLTHPAVQDHTRRLIRTAVNTWGFPYLKLDFLYAAALPGRRRDPTRTRAQALRLGLEIIRQAAGPDTFLLGCGCPLGPAVGLVDAMRIGADVAPDWRPVYNGTARPFRSETTMPAARNAIRNSLTRAALHRRWWLNDPDCLLVRDTSNLTRDEVIALATVIALAGGLVLVSDDLTRLSPERRRLIPPLLPVIGQAALARDWLQRDVPELLELPLRGAAGSWTVFGLCNWSERPAARALALAAESHVLDFWNQTYHRARADEPLAFDLPPHGARLLAVRPIASAPQFVGSSFHFSQGCEIEEWETSERSLRLAINIGRRAEGTLFLSLPSAPRTSTDRGEPIAEGIYRFSLPVERRAELRLEW